MGPSFTGTSLLLSDFATINFASPGAPTSTFTESGTLAVGGVKLNSAFVTPVGLNTTYGLYFSFVASGSQSNNPSGGASGSFSNLSYSLYGYSMPAGSMVTYSPTNATPTISGTPVSNVLLATGQLQSGSVSLSPTGSPSADLSSYFTVVDAPFFVAPVPFYNFAFSAFVNTTDQFTVDQSTGAITIREGGGTASFATVPEPITLGLLGVGLAATVVARRRRDPA